MSTRHVPARTGWQAASGTPTAEEPASFAAEIRTWLFASGNYYLASMLIHMTLLLFLALVLGVRYVAASIGHGPEFEVVEAASKPPALDAFSPFDSSTTGNATMPPIDFPVPLPQGPKNQTEPDRFYDATPDQFVEASHGSPDADLSAQLAPGGELSAANLGPGPRAQGSGGLIDRVGGRLPGPGDPGFGYANRSIGQRKQSLADGGGTKDTERAVLAALDWLARHQNPDGSWSLTRFADRCRNGRCDGAGSVESDAAATAFGLLPFLAHGEKHTERCTYQNTVRRGLYWLIAHQARNGDLSAGSSHVMYTHGLATIALCEAFGMTHDSRVGYAAAAAVRFIEAAQNRQDGGWRYRPGDAGDTSVVGWQVMALKSAQMAGIEVNPAALEGARKWLAAAGGGDYGGLFSYQPGGGKTTTMSSVGLLCREYLGASRHDPGLAEGTKLLLANLPDAKGDRNIYYWYYATQVLHNKLDADWDAWNRKLRRVLVETQAGPAQGCARGSWDPARPTPDAWGGPGGRVMVTSLSCLTLEVYYRYLPLYDLEKQGPVKRATK